MRTHLPRIAVAAALAVALIPPVRPAWADRLSRLEAHELEAKLRSAQTSAADRLAAIRKAGAHPESHFLYALADAFDVAMRQQPSGDPRSYEQVSEKDYDEVMGEIVRAAKTIVLDSSGEGDEVVDFLRVSLQSDSSWVRCVAIRIALELKDEGREIHDHFMNVWMSRIDSLLGQDPNPYVRLEAARAQGPAEPEGLEIHLAVGLLPIVQDEFHIQGEKVQLGHALFLRRRAMAILEEHDPWLTRANLSKACLEILKPGKTSVQ